MQARLQACLLPVLSPVPVLQPSGWFLRGCTLSSEIPVPLQRFGVKLPTQLCQNFLKPSADGSLLCRSWVAAAPPYPQHLPLPLERLRSAGAASAPVLTAEVTVAYSLTRAEQVYFGKRKIK